MWFKSRPSLRSSTSRPGVSGVGRPRAGDPLEIELASDHAGDQLVLRHLVAIECALVLAVAEHGDAIADAGRSSAMRCEM